MRLSAYEAPGTCGVTSPVAITLAYDTIETSHVPVPRPTGALALSVDCLRAPVLRHDDQLHRPASAQHARQNAAARSPLDRRGLRVHRRGVLGCIRRGTPRCGTPAR